MHIHGPASEHAQSLAPASPISARCWVFAPLDLFGETANHSIIFQFHACAAFGTDREFAVAPAFSARMIRAPQRKVT